MWGEPNNMMAASGIMFIFQLLNIALWVLLLVAAYYGVRWLMRKVDGGKSTSALHILEERYARGEINKQEFEEKKKDLE